MQPPTASAPDDHARFCMTTCVFLINFPAGHSHLIIIIAIIAIIVTIITNE
jgi:hypothetical protein